MPKILVFSVPLYGHVNPMLPVVGELVSRGEEVAYYITEEFEPQIRRTGAYFRRIDSPKPPQVLSRRKPRRTGRPLEGGLSRGRCTEEAYDAAPPAKLQKIDRFFPQIVERMSADLELVPRLVDRVQAEDADYVVYDRWCLWGRALAELLDLPAVTFNPMFAMSDRTPLVRRMSSIFDGQLSPEAAQAMGYFQDISQHLQERYGLVPLRPTELFTHAEAMNIVTIPRQFQPHADEFDERYEFVGPSFAPGSDTSGFPLDRLADRPSLYVSLGTVLNNNPEFFAACFDAFADTDWQVVMAIGRRIDPSTLGRVPGNFLVRPYVPQLKVLEHTDVLVANGGMNTIMHAIYYGVPMVVVPQQPEQAMTAARVAELGLGVALEPGQVTTDALRDAVAAVKGDAGYLERIARLQKVTRNTGGYPRAADVIQQFGRQRSKIKK